MNTKKHQHKKTYHNDIALRLGHKLLGMEHLHYGYFKGLKPSLQTLPKAQEQYVKQLLATIPKGVKNIFDVGCGTGGVAKELVKKKYNVTCLAPDPFLTDKARENTGGKVDTITDLYENVENSPQEKLDLVLMSESCQYIKVKEGWEQNAKFLPVGGHVLIADFFKIRPIDVKHVSKSGHNLEDFLKAAEEHGFKLVKKQDITKEVAPTMDIYQDLIFNKVFPVFEAVFEFVQRTAPTIYKILKKVLSKKIDKLHKHYSNQGSGTFTKYKGYFILLFKKVK